MKVLIHRADERGGGDHGWLKTRHSFSFADWYEPTRMGFGALRVINDDWIAPHQGFGAHSHRDMEIITIVTSGTLIHEDSMGIHGVIPSGDVQIMSAGSGVVHSERNEGNEPLTLFQIWIEAKEKSITPRYDQRKMHLDDTTSSIHLLVAPLGTPDALTINQDAYIYHIFVDAKHPFVYDLNDPRNGVYIFVIDGELMIAEEILRARDAMGITGVNTIEMRTTKTARLLVFEVPID